MWRDDGFTLLESLIAIAIIGAITTTGLMVMASARAREAEALGRFRASLAAEAILNRVGLDLPLTPGRRKGQLPDGTTWEIEIRPHAFETGAAREPDRIRILDVVVRITPGTDGARPVELTSLKRIGSRHDW
ncbi:prepilin-type N-terminal cleavage/methylation domain-containing protein (plasmid) [Tistrella mobilis]|uniref:prepilin-type N-terminal cleavage/methylation domain-containing protein n=1 Tax=Tistrella mobilis TaxID=171437 RepID=UPI003555F296